MEPLDARLARLSFVCLRRANPRICQPGNERGVYRLCLLRLKISRFASEAPMSYCLCCL